MIGVQWPSVQSNIWAKATRLDEPLCRVMAPLAQALKRTEPEFVDIAVVRLDVIADRRRRDDAALQAEVVRAGAQAAAAS
jgi:hypothetical protein